MKFLNLQWVSFAPEDYTKDYANDSRHEKPDGIVSRVSPVWPVLFPKASLALNYEALRKLGGKVKVIGAG